jgi:hypothetical protein
VSLLDPKRTAGDGSNDDRKVEFRHQMSLSSSRLGGGQGFHLVAIETDRELSTAWRTSDAGSPPPPSAPFISAPCIPRANHFVQNGISE